MIEYLSTFLSYVSKQQKDPTCNSIEKKTDIHWSRKKCNKIFKSIQFILPVIYSIFPLGKWLEPILAFEISNLQLDA